MRRINACLVLSLVLALAAAASAQERRRQGTSYFDNITVSGTGGITLKNGDSINNDTDATFDFTRNTAGTVTLTASDDNSVAAMTLLPGGAAALTLGGASTTSITLTTDGGSVTVDGVLNGVAPGGITGTPATTGIWTITRDATGTVSLTAADDDATAAFSIYSGGAAALNLYTGGAAAVNVGNTNSTSVSICNSAACDTVTIGSNADDDTITIGDSTDTNVSITDDNWSVTVAGVATFVSGDLTGAAGLTLQNDETITNAVDGTVLLTRNDAGTVTVSSADNDATAAMTIDPGGNAALTLGSAADTISVAATSGLTLSNSETVSNGTDGTITLGRNDTGVVTITCADDDATAGCTYDAGGAAPIIIGSADVTQIELTTTSGTVADADLLKIDGITNGTAAASKALVLDSAKGIASINNLTAANIRPVANTALTAAAVDLTKAQFQASGYFPVDTTANAVDVEVAEALDAADIGVVKLFVVTTGGTNALTVTADGAGVTTVTTTQQGAGATCEDVNDWIRCTVIGAQVAHCESFCAD